MPYAVVKQGNMYRIIKKDTGEIAKNQAGTPLDGNGHQSRQKALAQVHAINISEHVFKK